MDLTGLTRNVENMEKKENARVKDPVKERVKEWEREKERLREIAALEEREKERDEELETERKLNNLQKSAESEQEKESQGLHVARCAPRVPANTRSLSPPGKCLHSHSHPRITNVLQL